jgi:hypothetical protein
VTSSRAGCARHHPVRTHRHLERHRGRKPEPVAIEPDGVEHGGVREAAHVDANADRTQGLDAATAHARVGVDGGAHDARYPALHDAIDAGRCTTVVRARLQGDVESRPPRGFAGLVQGHDLGVRIAVPSVVAGANFVVAPDHDCAHDRVRPGSACAQTRQVARDSGLAVALTNPPRHSTGARVLIVIKRFDNLLLKPGRNWMMEKHAQTRRAPVSRPRVIHAREDPFSIQTVTVGPGVTPDLRRFPPRAIPPVGTSPCQGFQGPNMTQAQRVSRHAIPTVL